MNLDRSIQSFKSREYHIMYELKKKLLSTDIFIDNIYLDKYVELIIANLTRLKEPKITQKHHILPRYYFKHNNMAVDNGKNNLVNLIYTDHILAHYYLALCSNSIKDRLGNEAALCRMIGRKGKHLDLIPEIDVKKVQKLYEEYQEHNSKKHQGKTHITSEETKQKISRKNKNKYHDYISLHKDDVEIRIPKNLLDDYLIQGYELGRSAKTRKALSNGYNYESKGMLGKKQSAYQKQRVKEALSGNKKSNEAKEKMKLAKLGKKKYINKNTGKVVYLDPIFEDDYLQNGFEKYSLRK